MEVAMDGRSGPRSDPIWEHFTRGERHGVSRVRAAKCNYCTRSWKYADLAQMKAHISTDCPGDMPVKMRSLGLVADQIGPPIKRRKRDKDVDDNGMLSSPMASNILMLRDAASKNLLKHKLPTAASGQSEKVLMVKAFVCNEIPVATIENKHFREWLRGINPSYKPSSSDDIRNLIQQQYTAEAGKLKELVMHGFTRITLTPSATVDAANHRIVRVVLSNQNRVEVIWHMAYSMEQADPSQSMSATLLANSIMEISPERFLAICTDNDADLIHAALEITKSYPWIIPLRCMAQLTSSLVRDWLKIPDINQVFLLSGQLLSYFRQNQDAALYLHESASQLNTSSCRLVPFSSQSWSDSFLSLASIQFNENAIKSTLIQACRSEAPSQQIYDIVTRNEYWSNLSCLVRLLRPIKTLTDLFQTPDVTIADAYAAIASLNSVLLSLCSSSATMNQIKLSNKVFAQMTPVINQLWEEIHRLGDGIGLLAYFCHPRYHKRGILRNQFKNILRTALQIWSRRRKNEHQARLLRQGLHDLWNGEGLYSVQTFLSSGVEPRSWLSVLPNGELVELGILLLEMQPLSTGHAKYDTWDALLSTLDISTKLTTDYATTCTRLKSIYEAREALTNPDRASMSASHVLAQADNIFAQCDAAASAAEEDPTLQLDDNTLGSHLESLAKDWGMIPTDEYDATADLNLVASMTFDLSDTNLHYFWKMSSVPSDPALMPTIVTTGQDHGFDIDELVSEYV